MIAEQAGSGLATAGLSKSRILVHLQCAKRLWLESFKPEAAAEDAGARPGMAVGIEVGVLARSLIPNGILIEAQDLAAAVTATRRSIEQHPTRPIFEGAFEYDGVWVRADLMLPEARGYRLVEVKSSTSVKQHHLADVAVQAWVMRGAGMRLASTAVAHLDSNFVYRGGTQFQGIFKHQNVSARLADVPRWVATARHTLAGSEPSVATGEHCVQPYECPFHAHCLRTENAHVAEYPVEDLPRAGKLIRALREDGFTDVRTVPAKRLAKPIHQRIRKAAITGKAFVGSNVKRILTELPQPWHYLDFETISPAIPIWAGMRPYVSQIPFQWSCHIETSADRLEHHAFLAEGSVDPRRAFAESLLSMIGRGGAILVYNAAFECARLEELAALFPDLAADLKTMVDRVVDLLPLVRQFYYHPAQHGSWSIKAVLPTIAPELAYDNLQVADGGMAQQAFAQLLDPKLAPEHRKELRAALLQYCERDTLAMIRIARRLRGADPAPAETRIQATATKC